MRQNHDRREFLQIAAAGAAASFAAGPALGAQRNKKARPPRAAARPPKFELGLASYTLRKFDLEQTLAMTKRVGLKHIAFKSFHLPLESTPQQIQEVAAKVKETGLDLYGGGVIDMKTEEQTSRAFEYAKAAGMRVIIGVPAPALLPLVDKKVKEYDIKVAIHNHGPGDKIYPLPRDVYEKIGSFDKRIGLCIDVGHTMRLGEDPAASIAQYADRLLDVHIKDVSAATAKGDCVEMGRGVIDIPQVFRTLIKIDYAGIVSFEYEKDPDDPLAGLAETVGYARGVLAALGS